MHYCTLLFTEKLPTEKEIEKIMSPYYEGNAKSKRVQEKAGFVYHHTCEEVSVPLLNEMRTGHTNYMTKERWAQLFQSSN